MNWDDLRIATAVYRAGSFAAAGEQLRINETTVARRLQRLQQDLGVVLFEAIDGMRTPTAECEALIAYTAQMAGYAERIDQLGNDVVGIAGRRRIASTDSIAADVLAPGLPGFLTAHPGLSVDLMVSTENVDFSRWGADLAIRLTKPEKGDFVISKLADLTLYLLEPAAAEVAANTFVCAYPTDLDQTPESQFLKATGRRSQVRCTTKNLQVVKHLLQSHQCTAILPSYMCQDLIEDDALQASKLPQRRGVWLLVQPHLRRDPATRTVIEWIRETFRSLD